MSIANITDGNTSPKTDGNSEDEILSIFHISIAMMCFSSLVTGALYVYDRRPLRIGAAVSWWFTVSLLFTLMNKWIFSSAGETLQIPLFISAVHMTMKGFLATAFVKWWERYPAGREGQDERLCAGRDSVRAVFAKDIAFVGICTSIDIALSNWSFEFVTVTTYTVFKSGMLLTTFAMCVFVGLEKVRPSLLAACATISFGIALGSYGDPDFDVLGLVLLFIAILAGSARWVGTQRIMHGDESITSAQLVMRIAPSGALTLLPFACAMEFDHLMRISGDAAKWLVVVSLCGGILSFGLVAIEVHLVRLTSSMALSVFGVAKSLLQIFFGVVVFADELTRPNVAGIALAVAGMLWYHYLRNSNRAELEKPIEINVEIPRAFGRWQNGDRYRAVEMQSDF